MTINRLRLDELSLERSSANPSCSDSYRSSTRRDVLEKMGSDRTRGPPPLTMAVASERLEKSLVEIEKRAEQDSESEDDSEQPEFEGNDGSDDDSSDSSDDDDAPAPAPAPAAREDSSSDDDSSDDDDDVHMAPAPAPALPRAPKKPARKRSRAGSPPARAAAPKPSPGKDLFKKKHAKMRRGRRRDYLSPWGEASMWLFIISYE